MPWALSLSLSYEWQVRWRHELQYQRIGWRQSNGIQVTEWMREARRAARTTSLSASLPAAIH